MKESKILIITILLISLSFMKTHADEKEDLVSHEIGIGPALISYKYLGKSSDSNGAFRSGIRFGNLLSFSAINYMLNIGYERHVSLNEANNVIFLYGLDVTVIGFGISGNYFIGGGPVIGVCYHINNRFTANLEAGVSYGFLNTGNDWSDGIIFHRNMNFMIGYRF